MIKRKLIVFIVHKCIILKSIKLEEKLDGAYKGGEYVIELKDTKGEVESVGIFGDRIEYGKYFFSIDSNIAKEIEKIYNELDYSEVNPLT